MRIRSMLAVGLFAVPQTVVAQDREPNMLFVTGAAQSGAGISGEGGEIEWLGIVSPRATVIVGGAVSSVSDLWWTYGTLGGSMRRRDVTYSGRVSLGSGRWLRSTFPYGRYLGAVTIPVAGSLYVDAEAQHVRIAGTTATVLQFGTTYGASRNVSVRLAYHAAPWDPTLHDAVSARGDFNVRRVTLMSGIVATARQTTPVNVQARDLTTRLAPEFFGGASLPVGYSSVIVSAQLVPQSRGQIVRLLVTLKHPLNGGNRRGESDR